MNRQTLQYTLFFIFTLVNSYALYVFPIETILNWAFKTPLFSLYSFIFTLITFAFIFYFLRSKTRFYPLKIFVFTGIGSGFFASIVIMIILLIDIQLYLQAQEKLILFFTAWPLLLLVSYLSALRLKETSLFYRSKKISKPYQFIFISDVHLGSNTSKHLHKIIHKIKQYDADALLIGGDLIDSSSFTPSELEILKSITIPIFFVTGNHEYYLKNSQYVIDHLPDYNIQVLNNETCKIDNISITGLSDNQSSSSQLEQLKTLNNTSTYNITLVHKPSIWPKAADYSDLMLSGHTHNGQIFPFNWLVKIQFPYHYGEYILGKSICYVSSGAGTWGPKMRFGSFNEIVIINLKPPTPSLISKALG